jgi:hypothetical protein
LKTIARFSTIVITELFVQDVLLNHVFRYRARGDIKYAIANVCANQKGLVVYMQLQTQIAGLLLAKGSQVEANLNLQPN